MLLRPPGSTRPRRRSAFDRAPPKRFFDEKSKTCRACAGVLAFVRARDYKNRTKQILPRDQMPRRNAAALAFLTTRRSRPAKLLGLPVPDPAQIEEILTAATRVPDHGKLEPWRLIVVQGAAFARLAGLAEARALELGGDAEKIAKGRGQFDLGKLAVVVIASPKPAPKIPPVEQLMSAAALCFGIVTVAEAAGWGACWLTGWPAHDPVFAARAFGCEGGETVAGIVHIGTPPEDGPDRPRPDLGRIVTWVEA
jgi:nitroreductase